MISIIENHTNIIKIKNIDIQIFILVRFHGSLYLLQFR